MSPSKKDSFSQSFYQLEPETVMLATEDAGFFPTGEFQQLNSYENRVFDLKIEADRGLADSDRVIAKFYRPGRWSKKAILEEHAFLQELSEENFPVPVAYKLNNGSTVLEAGSIFAAFFPKIKGRMPDEFIGNDLHQVGRRLAHLHNIGEQSDFKFRPIFNQTPYNGDEQLDLLQSWIYPEVQGKYTELAEDILSYADELIDPQNFQRIHGDCHRGNLLNNTKEFFFVDFDDSMMGPVEQDFWMLMSGFSSQEEEENFLAGYSELRTFNRQNKKLFPVLRGLRILHYSAWIARRWEDPSFPKLFPDFKNYNYWATEIDNLERILRELRKGYD